MAILFKEAQDAGFSACSQRPRPTFEAAFAAFVAANKSPPAPYDDILREFTRGWSSAIAYQMDAY